MEASMNVGDLVKMRKIKKTRQVGIITDTLQLITRPDRKKYKVRWADGFEEYWFNEEELEVL
jgi:hypothetical protein